MSPRSVRGASAFLFALFWIVYGEALISFESLRSLLEDEMRFKGIERELDVRSRARKSWKWEISDLANLRIEKWEMLNPNEGNALWGRSIDGWMKDMNTSRS